MSDLIVIGYDNPQTARQAYEQVQRLQQDFVVELRGLAIVDVDADGKTHVDTPQRIIGASAASGALFGLLLGLLFFVPGMVLLGGAIGALMGTFTKSGIDAEFRNRVEHLVEPGHSAVVIMASKITEDKFAGAMQPFGGTILKTSLSESDEKELAEELPGRAENAARSTGASPSGRRPAHSVAQHGSYGGSSRLRTWRRSAGQLDVALQSRHGLFLLVVDVLRGRARVVDGSWAGRPSWRERQKAP